MLAAFVSYLERHHLLGQVTEALEDGGVASLTELLQLDVGLELPVRRIASEGRITLGPTSGVSVKEQLTLGSLRSPGPLDHIRNNLCFDLLV